MSNIVNRFDINDSELLFFDIFFKNNKIYLILPIYNEPYDTDDIKIKVNNTDNIYITTKFIKNNWEPALIYIYDYISDLKQIELSIEYNNITKSFVLEHIISNNIHHKLSLTTLFKDDYVLFPFFYNYYKNQGVSHFYMYYNGKITSEIRRIFDKSDVTLIEWDFPYWIDKKINSKHMHHAQMGQMHDAIYRFGKDICDYMIFCDLDEYLYIANTKLIKFIEENNNIDIIGFCNKWSDVVDDSLLRQPLMFPSKLLTSPLYYYGNRSKNIYNLNSINIIGIHRGYEFSKIDINSVTDFYMFHFYKWNNSIRETKIDGNCNILEIIY